jgi:hypothetical protein
MVKHEGITPENRFPLLHSPMAVSFTPLQQTLGKADGDLWLVCGCTAKETQFMKLLTNSYCADFASRGSLELGFVANEDKLFLVNVLKMKNRNTFFT